MNLLDIIRAEWSFAGLDAAEVIDANPFGNVLVRDTRGQYWRICPEELSCELVARSIKECEQLRSSAEFQEDWAMQTLVDLARYTLGPPGEGRCYCLKIPAVLGGAYDRTNLGTTTLSELIAAAGDMARQIKDLPDGATIKLSVVE